MNLFIFLLNEFMAFLTITIVFPGFLPPEDAVGWVMTFMFFFCMSCIWWLYIAVSPIAFLIIWLLGDLRLSHWADEWPWNLLKKMVMHDAAHRH